MAFGLTPSYKKETLIEPLSQSQFLVASIEAIKSIGWRIGPITENGFWAFSGFSIFSYGEQIKITIDDNFAILESQCTGAQLWDWGRNKRNIKRLSATIEKIRDMIPAEELDEKYEGLKPDFLQSNPENDGSNLELLKGRRFGFLSFFDPVPGYFVTPILINLNILAFIFLWALGVDPLFPTVESLIEWGANYRPATVKGGWWRMITCCFMHAGAIHLILNIYALHFVGKLLEPQIGRFRFLSAWFITGFLASVNSVYWHYNIASVGASGAIFGLYGVFIALLLTNLIEKNTRKSFLTSMLVFVGYSLVNGMDEGIDNAAHVGGLLSGLVMGFVFVFAIKKKEEKDLVYTSTAFLFISMIMVGFYVLSIVPRDFQIITGIPQKPSSTPSGSDIYYDKLVRFDNMESSALEVFKMSKNTPKDELISELKNRGIYYWNENLEICRQISEMELPEELKERNDLMTEYCKLRLLSYNLMVKSIEEFGTVDNEEIRGVNVKIMEILKKIKATKP